jgi:aspartate kinase
VNKVKNNYKVLKFGGTSVYNAHNNIKDIVLNELKENTKIILVLSALNRITNLLFDISNSIKNKDEIKTKKLIQDFYNKHLDFINQILKTSLKEQAISILNETINLIDSYRNEGFNLTSKEEKVIVAQGEILSSNIYYFYFLENGIKCSLINALDFIKLKENRELDWEFIENSLLNILKNNIEDNLIITQGYICRNAFGDIDNLGRGGSDYTASIIGNIINAKEIYIYSDVSGLHNNDPRFVNRTYPINYISFEEAAELAYFGAKVLHPSTILPAHIKNIPVILKNTFNPFSFGTVITNEIPVSEGFKAVAAKDNITIIKIKNYRMLMAYGYPRAVFEIFERYKTPVDMITTSEVSISVTIDNTDYLQDIINELSEIAAVEVIPNNTIICIVGYIPINKSGYLFKVLESIKDIPIRMISYGSSDYNISLCVDTIYKQQVLQKLNKNLFEI